MTQFSRGAKAAGGTSFTAGVIASGEVNVDLDTIYNGYNGANVQNENVSATADIVQTKIADSGDTTTMLNPDGGAATSLLDDIRQLRFVLDQILGQTNWYDDADEDIRNLTRRVASQNLLRNGSFEAPTGAGTLPDGWAATGTPTHSIVAASAVDGAGRAYRVTAGAVNSGITQTLTLLKASTRYHVTISGYVTAADSSNAITTGGAGPHLSLSWTETTSTRKQGFFETDATPTAIVLSLRATAATDVATFDNVEVVELGPIGMRPATAQGRIMTTAQLSTNTVITTNIDLGFSETVFVPGPGYYIKVTLVVGFVIDRTVWSAGAAKVVLELQENINGGGAATVETQRGYLSSVNDSTPNNSHEAIPLSYIVESPTVGASYLYTARASEVTGSPADPVTEASNRRIIVEVIPYS